jgi:DNA-binding response OmpR family regulator
MKEMPRATGTEILLVVEDEELLRDAIAMILRGAGYTVRTAGDGGAGLRELETNPGIALVLMDLGLPDMPGSEAYERMRALRPSVRCIVVSGSLDSTQRASLTEAGVRATIRKPFQRAEMLGTVRRVLDSPGETGAHLRGAG